jgi:hypothetical protein
VVVEKETIGSLKNKIFLILIAINSISCLYSQDNIYNILNKEIVIHDNFAGQSLTLVKEGNNYYIYRKIFGSGVPYIGVIKYNVIFDSEYKITISKIVTISENIKNEYSKKETIEIYYRNELEIYLNGMKISINYIKDN